MPVAARSRQLCALKIFSQILHDSPQSETRPVADVSPYDVGARLQRFARDSVFIFADLLHSCDFEPAFVRPASHWHWDEDQLSSLQSTPTSASRGPIVRGKRVVLEAADVKASTTARAYAAVEGVVFDDSLPADVAGGKLPKKAIEVRRASPSAVSTAFAELEVFRFV